MKLGGGRYKGFGFEIDVSRMLSLWVLEEKETKPSIDIFWRSTGSGGKSAMERSKGRLTQTDGDIMCVDPRGDFLCKKFFFECKNYKKFDVFLDLFYQKGTVWEWWKKCVLQSGHAGKVPILIMKQNRFAPLVVLLGKTVGELTGIFGEFRFSYCEFSSRDVFICNLQHFLEWVDAEGMRRWVC